AHDDLVAPEKQHGLGPLLPWSAEADLYGCRWRAETTWSPEANYWTVWLRCEDVLIGACHLEDAAWAMGTGRLVDPDELLDPALGRALEIRLREAFIESVAAEVEQPVLSYLEGRGWSGLARRIREGRNACEHITRIIEQAFAGASMPGSAEELTSGGIDG